MPVRQEKGTTEIIINIVTCDECGIECHRGQHGHYRRQCVVCERHFCENHLVRNWYDPLFMSADGDDLKSFCQPCWKVGQPHREQIEYLQNKLDEEIETQWKAWKKESEDD